MDKIRTLPVSGDMFRWLKGEDRPFGVHVFPELSADTLFINPKECYDEVVHAMGNGCIEAHHYDTHPHASDLLIIARDNALYGVEVVALYLEE